MQTMTREQIEKLQLKRLKETVKLAWDKSLFYRQIYEEVGIAPEDIQSLEDIRKLPLIDATNLVDCGDDMVCVNTKEISRIVTLETSGSYAEPKRVWFTEEDQELTISFFHYGMKNIVDSRDKVLILMPCKRPGSVGDLLNTGLKRLGAVTLAYGLIENGRYQEIIEILKEKKVTAIVAVPFQIEKLLELSKKESGKITSVKNILLSADYVKDELCQEISTFWGAEVYEHYGMTEMGLGCAVSCGYEPNGSGYHVRELDLFIEIIDPITGQVLPDGEQGELVFTSLTRQGMPFIRYKTGDISKWLTKECQCKGRCSWGGSFRRIDKVGKRNLKKGYF